jgi:tRNA wybutosine-synthesizing protein 2
VPSGPSGRVRGPARPPAERVRDRLRAAGTTAWVDRLPAGYQRLGRVLLLRLPGEFRPHFAAIGRAWQAELGVETVLTQVAPVVGEFREPRVEAIAGRNAETEVVEHGVRWRFDAARIMFAAGNRAERLRAGALVRPGESVVDLFAGIGYFAIPAARSSPTVRVVAVEKNPVAYAYLADNVRRNGVADRVECLLGDNRTVPLPEASADRVFLGFLPDATPWVARALGLLRAEGGWLHVHRVADVHGGKSASARSIETAVVEAGGETLAPARAREVKPYGPGRAHVVVDVAARARR